MFRKLNSKKLLLVFGSLLLLVVAMLVVDSIKGDRTFKEQILMADTADIKSITILPRLETARKLTLARTESGWEVSKGDKTVKADEASVASILEQLAALKPLRVAATKSDQWRDYELTDSLATVVTISFGKRKKQQVYLGKFNYKQPQGQNPYAMYGQQPRGTMTTAVRTSGDKNTYIVDGFLGMTFNRDINDFRNKTVLRSNAIDLTKLSFSYPADSSFDMVKEAGVWKVAGVAADSAEVANYVNAISHLNSYSFADGISPEGAPLYTLTVEGNNFTTPLLLEVFASADSSLRYLVRSSTNTEALFSDPDGSAVVSRVFVPKSKFLK